MSSLVVPLLGALLSQAAPTVAPRLEILAPGVDPTLRREAELTAEELRQDERFTSVALQTAFAANAAAPPWPAVDAALAQAQVAYEQLEATTGLERLAEAEGLLLQHLVDAEAVGRLSILLRLRGLLLLYQQDPSAGPVFAAAARLDPDFSPAAYEWPPEARLAYADAIASARRAATGSLSLRVSPEHAGVFVDGKPVGVGPRTLTELEPGLHYVVARAPGAPAVGVVISIEGDGKLTEAPLFLAATEAADAQTAARAQLLGTAPGDPSDDATASALLVCGVDAFLVWQRDAAAQPTATLRGRDAVVPLGGTAAESAARLKLHVFGEPLPTTASTPWYQSWIFWGGVGVVVAAGVTTAVVLATRPDDNRVTLFVGRP